MRWAVRNLEFTKQGANVQGVGLVERIVIEDAREPAGPSTHVDPVSVAEAPDVPASDAQKPTPKKVSCFFNSFPSP